MRLHELDIPLEREKKKKKKRKKEKGDITRD